MHIEYYLLATGGLEVPRAQPKQDEYEEVQYLADDEILDIFKAATDLAEHILQKVNIPIYEDSYKMDPETVKWSTDNVPINLVEWFQSQSKSDNMASTESIASKITDDKNTSKADEIDLEATEIEALDLNVFNKYCRQFAQKITRNSGNIFN